MEKEIDNLAKIIWDYMVLDQLVLKADVIFALGSNDIRVADRAAELWKQKYDSFLVCSGGVSHVGDFNETPWHKRYPQKTEAQAYKERLMELNIPENCILLEEKASNTGENARFIYSLLKEKNLNYNSFIVVQKKFSERRVFATFLKQYPGIEKIKFFVSSPQLSYQEYMNSDFMPSPDYIIPKDVFLNVMVGDLQRVKESPHQVPQEVPVVVWDAYHKLLKLGYNKYLMK